MVVVPRLIRIRFAVMAVGLAGVLAACAGPNPKVVTQALRARLTSTQVVIALHQTQIYAQNHRSTEESAMPLLLKQLAAFDLDGAFEEGIRSGLATVDWLHADKVMTLQVSAFEDYDNVVSRAAEPYSLVLATEYHLSSGFNRLTIRMRATLYPRGANAGAQGRSNWAPRPIDPVNRLYSRSFTYVETIPASAIWAMPEVRSSPTDNLTPDERKSLIYWTQDDGAKLKKTLRDGALELGRMLAFDLQGPPPEHGDAQEVDIPNAGRGRVLYREAGGRVVFLDGDDFVSADDIAAPAPADAAVGTHR